MQISKADQVRGKKERKPKKISKSQLNKKADKEWSIAVKNNAGFKCEVCGSTQYLNSHHIFGRRNYGVRHCLDNGVCLCAKHHNFSNEFSAHQTPTLFVEWLILKRGKEAIDMLTLKAKSVFK